MPAKWMSHHQCGGSSASNCMCKSMVQACCRWCRQLSCLPKARTAALVPQHQSRRASTAAAAATAMGLSLHNSITFTAATSAPHKDGRY